jgi:hypothetical protein
MYECMNACMNVWLSVCICMNVCMYVCMYVCVYTYEVMNSNCVIITYDTPLVLIFYSIVALMGRLPGLFDPSDSNEPFSADCSPNCSRASMDMLSPATSSGYNGLLGSTKKALPSSRLEDSFYFDDADCLPPGTMINQNRYGMSVCVCLSVCLCMSVSFCLCLCGRSV